MTTRLTAWQQETRRTASKDWNAAEGDKGISHILPLGNTATKNVTIMPGLDTEIGGLRYDEGKAGFLALSKLSNSAAGLGLRLQYQKSGGTE
ncbi:hypothetical protein AtubIFM57258_001270 [Aspergillus tubingensis]|nr:hypothetical protein AtubIFM57258_001270 [Aspergillus tubingensis]